MNYRDFKSPKKQRKGSAGGTGPPTSPVLGPSDVPAEAVGEVVGGNEALNEVLAPQGPPGEAVTDTARAFRQLRVRPAMSGVEHQHPHSRVRSPGGHPRSPKKRKATVNIDKGYLLKDDKVKRNTDQQGDISQARGMLGQLLFEFGQLELNKDLLEAIKRTESRTGRLSRSSRAQELDRIAFECVVAEVCELLHSQAATVAGHTEDVEQQRAIMRAYAVQAIATFADEDYSSEEEEEGGGYSSGGQERSPSPGQRRLLDMQHSSDTRAREGEEGGDPDEDGCASCRSQSVDMLRAGSVTPLPLSPDRQHAPRGGGGEAPQPHGAQQAQQAQQGESASEAVSSSVLPDAPSEAALEDTAAQRPRQAGDEAASLADQQQSPSPFLHPSGSQQQQQQQRGEGSEGRREDSLPCTAQSSGLDDVMQQLSDAVDDMLRSPEAVTSRLAALPPGTSWGPPATHLPLPLLDRPPQDSSTQAAPSALGQEGAGEVAGLLPQLQRKEQQQHELGGGPGAGSGPDAPRQPHHPRLHYHPHRTFRAHHPHHQQQQRQQEPLPSLQEEGSAREGGGGNGGEAGPHLPGARLPLSSLSPQQVQQQQQQSSGSGSGGTQQSGMHNEALKRQRTGAASRPHPAQQAQQGQQAQQWAQQLERGAGGAGPGPAQHLPYGSPPAHQNPLEVTSPLLNPQLQADHAQQLPQQLQPPPQQQQQQLALPPAGPGPGPGPGPAPQEQGGGGQPGQPVPGPAAAAEGSVETHGVARCGSSVWGSTLVCADLTVNDVASKYWPFLRGAMQGQGTAALHDDDSTLVASLVQALGEAINTAYATESGGRRPSPETKSLVAATAFDDMFAQETSERSK